MAESLMSRYIPEKIFQNRSVKIDVAYRLVMALIGVALCLQLLVQPTVRNFLAAFCASVSSWVTLAYLFGRQKAFVRYPLSSISIFGLNVSTQSGALLYQSFTLTPISFNLKTPAETFFLVGLLQLTLVLAHFFYCRSKLLALIRDRMAGRLLRSLGLFKAPTDGQLWVMGFVGMIALWFSLTSLRGAEFGDVGAKFLAGFVPFAYAPLLILFRRQILPLGQKVSYLPFAAYLLVLILIGMGGNGRGVFAMAFLMIGLLFLLLYVTGQVKVEKRQFVRFVLIAIPAAFLMHVASDLAIAMAIVRAHSEGLFGWDLIHLTWDTFWDNHALAAYKNSLKYLIFESYNETYISNPFFSRLVTVKFDDNMIHYAGMLGSEKANQLLNVSCEKFIAFLPTPLLHFLGYHVDKSNLEFSIGDYIYYLVSGGGLGGFRTGSITAYGIIVFGGFFYVLMFLLAPFIFMINDAFSRRTPRGLVVSPLMLMSLYQLFTLFNGDSLLDMVGYYLRGIPQLIFLYLLLQMILFAFAARRRFAGYAR